MLILWINSRFLALIAQLTVSLRHLFEMKIQLKEVIVLTSHKNVSQLENLYCHFMCDSLNDMHPILSLCASDRNGHVRPFGAVLQI